MSYRREMFANRREDDGRPARSRRAPRLIQGDFNLLCWVAHWRVPEDDNNMPDVQTDESTGDGSDRIGERRRGRGGMVRSRRLPQGRRGMEIERPEPLLPAMRCASAMGRPTHRLTHVLCMAGHVDIDIVRAPTEAGDTPATTVAMPEANRRHSAVGTDDADGLTSRADLRAADRCRAAAL